MPNSGQILSVSAAKISSAPTERKVYSYIRWSSPRQTSGDSLRRQTEGAERYANEHGWTIADDCRLVDVAKSAFHGRNLDDKAALGSFLKAIREHQIPRGAILIVENFDRLSRQDILPFIADTLTPILRAGVDLVILHDNQHWTYERANREGSLFLLSVAIAVGRGKDESKAKSQRLLEKWKARRNSVANGTFIPLGTLPWWLENGKDSYVEKPGTRKLIQRIFDLYLAGNGGQIIASRLNAEKIPLPPNKDGTVRKNANGWHPTYIQNLIKNRALIGYYFKTDYKIFPPMIPESDFYAANAKRKERVRFAGRRAEHINPVAGLVYCAKCGGHIITHHSGVKKYGKIRYSYLMCGESRRGKCSAAGIPWEVFDDSFECIWDEKEMVNALMGDDKGEPSKLPELEGRLAEIASRIRQAEADYEKSPSTPLARTLAKMEAQESALKKELEDATISERGTVGKTDALEDFYNLYFDDDWKSPETRLKIQECVRNLIDHIVVDVAGRAYTVHFKGGKKWITVTDLKAEECRVDGVWVILKKGVGTKYDDARHYSRKNGIVTADQLPPPPPLMLPAGTVRSRR